MTKIFTKVIIKARVGFDGNFDEKSFLDYAKKQVVKLLDKHRGSKVKLGLMCDMVRVILKTGEEHVGTPKFIKNGSGWQLLKILRLDDLSIDLNPGKDQAKWNFPNS